MRLKLIAIILIFLFAYSRCTDKSPEPVKLEKASNTENTTATISGTLLGYNHRILALGDSYTIGQNVSKEERYPNQVVKKLNDLGYACSEPKIIAQTGWTTTNLTNAIGVEGDTNKYDFVFLLIGVNNQYQGKSIDNYKSEFTSLLKIAIKFANNAPERVIVVSIPDYAFTPFGKNSNPTKISTEINSFNAANKDITSSFSGVSYVDVTAISRKGIEMPSYVANDGLHPSGEQYGLWADEILEAIVPKLLAK